MGEGRVISLLLLVVVGSWGGRKFRWGDGYILFGLFCECGRCGVCVGRKEGFNFVGGSLGLAMEFLVGLGRCWRT